MGVRLGGGPAGARRRAPRRFSPRSSSGARPTGGCSPPLARPTSRPARRSRPTAPARSPSRSSRWGTSAARPSSPTPTTARWRWATTGRSRWSPSARPSRSPARCRWRSSAPRGSPRPPRRSTIASSWRRCCSPRARSSPPSPSSCTDAGGWGLAVHGLARLLAATVGRVSGRVQRVSDAASIDAALERYYRTLDGVAGDRRALAAAVGFTLLGWVCFSLPLYTTARAVGVDLPLFLAFFLVPASGLTTAFPLPGGLGGYEIALAGAMVFLVSADPGAAAAAVLLYRLWSYWLLLLVGGVAAAFAATTDRRGEGQGDRTAGRD
ncbi:flippase-like domain-containing protein [Natronomonas salina]|uniref:lysylphosphatidylglycerol synthase transmembrane domain-containing protein n=1 Tax=Natronomonas salina TaxID=1710540 RepID=UPI0015B61545|nr:lysylphosphatidylglycerol synthase transmembrane domain-containing protein [Natronomonas salina]QLD89933.1 flippase-like domain-containing protein [Natronomonas salina]